MEPLAAGALAVAEADQIMAVQPRVAQVPSIRAAAAVVVQTCLELLAVALAVKVSSLLDTQSRETLWLTSHN